MDHTDEYQLCIHFQYVSDMAGLGRFEEALAAAEQGVATLKELLAEGV